MTRFPTLAAEWDAFRALPREQLIASVLQIIDRIHDDARPFDFDHLMWAGIMLAQSSVPVADLAKAVIEWAHAVPDENGLGMAAALLNGLWKIRREAPMVFDEDLLRYIGLIESIPTELEVDNIRQTLDVILPSIRGPLRDRVHDVAVRLGGAGPR